jgi:hypothetical protein
MSAFTKTCQTIQWCSSFCDVQLNTHQFIVRSICLVVVMILRWRIKCFYGFALLVTASLSGCSCTDKHYGGDNKSPAARTAIKSWRRKAQEQLLNRLQPYPENLLTPVHHLWFFKFSIEQFLSDNRKIYFDFDSRKSLRNEAIQSRFIKSQQMMGEFSLIIFFFLVNGINWMLSLGTFWIFTAFRPNRRAVPSKWFSSSTELRKAPPLGSSILPVDPYVLWQIRQ